MVAETKVRAETFTFCVLCSAHCAAKATVEDGKIVKWEQDKESGLEYLPCRSFKGLANKEINEHPDRLKYPLKRVGARGEGKWQRISWDEALDGIASKLTELKEKYGPQCLATGVGEPKAMEFVWIQRFATAFGTPNAVTPLAVCGAQANAANSASYGSGHFRGEGARNPKLVIVWGKASSDKTARDRETVKRMVRNGAKLVVIDPRRIGITKDADLWIKPRPNSDSALAFGLLKVIIEEGLYDKDFVDKWTLGFGQIREEIKKFTLDDVERVTWVPKEQIKQVGRWLGELKPSQIQTMMGAFKQAVQGFQGQRILDILQGIITPQNIPNWGRRNIRPNTTPAAKMYLLDKLPRNVEWNLASQHKYAVRSAYIPDQALYNGIFDDKVKAVILTQCDPLVTYPDARRTYEALTKLDLLVVLNVFMVPTAAIADYVLPVATTNECDVLTIGTGANPPHAVPKIVDPPGEAQSDVMIINKLGKKLGLEEFFFDSDVDSINYVLAPSGLAWEDLKKKRVLEGKTEEIEEEGGFFTTPSGKLEIYSSRAEELYGCSPLPLWKEVQPFREPSSEYPLLMTSFADEEFRLSAWKHVKYFRKRKPYPTVQLNPEVAQKIGAKDGDWIWIETEAGRIVQKLVIDPEMDTRVVMTTFGWFFPEDPTNACQWDKSNINILTRGEPVETSSGAVDLRGYPCRVYKAQESEVNLPLLDLTPGTSIVSAKKA